MLKRYLESLAGFARSGHKGFCRQTLVGGNYELVDKCVTDKRPRSFRALRALQILFTVSALVLVACATSCQVLEGP